MKTIKLIYTNIKLRQQRVEGVLILIKLISNEGNEWLRESWIVSGCKGSENLEWRTTRHWDAITKSLSNEENEVLVESGGNKGLGESSIVSGGSDETAFMLLTCKISFTISHVFMIRGKWKKRMKTNINNYLLYSTCWQSKSLIVCHCSLGFWGVAFFC